MSDDKKVEDVPNLKVVQPEEIDCRIEQVKMQESEDIRLTITKTKDNELSIHVKTHEGEDVKQVSFFEVIGILETAKGDLLRQENHPQGQPAQAQDMEMVFITLVDEDFELDGQGQLKASGKKVGDQLQMPAQIAELRDNAIANLNRIKESAGAGAPMNVVEKDTPKKKKK